MRGSLAVLVLLVLVTFAPAGPLSPSATGVVLSHGFPVKARIEVWRLRTGASVLPESSSPDWPHSILTEAPPRSGPPLFSVETDAEGRFAFDRLEVGDYSVRAIAGERTAFKRLELPLPGAVRRLRMELSVRGAPVREGVVAWSDGQPVRGIITGRDAAVEIAAEGRFTVHARRLIGVFVPGRLFRRFQISADAGEALRITVDEGLVPVAGRVLDAESGAPLAGARVTADGHDREHGSVTTGAVADADGRFRFPALPGATLHASAPGRLRTAIRLSRNVDPVEMLLPRAPVISGRVVWPEKSRGVSGVPIYLLALIHDPIESGRFMTPAGATAVTTEEGRFTIVSPVAGDVMIFAFGEGWFTPGLEHATSGGYNPAALTLVAGESREVDVAIVRSPSIVGRLSEPDGTGVPGVVVFAGSSPEGRSQFQWRMGWFAYLTLAVTASDGSYRIPTVMPGLPWAVEAWLPERPGAEAGPATPAVAEEVRLDLALPTLRPDRHVAVRVVSADSGKPVPGAQVRISTRPAQEQDASPLPVVTEETHGGVTGPDGRVRLGPFSRTPLVARVRHGDHAPVDDQPVPGTDEDVCDLAMTIALESGNRIAGRVLYPDGAPAAGAAFSVSRPGARTRHLAYRTDAEGWFRVRGLGEGTFEVEISGVVRDGRRYRGSVEVDAGEEDAVLRLEESTGGSSRHGPGRRPPLREDRPGLDIRIRDESGKPVASGSLLFTAHKIYGRGRKGLGAPDLERFEKGEARFEFGKSERAVWIDVRPDPTLAPRLGPTLVGPFEAEDFPVTIVLGPRRTLGGRMSAPEGTAVRGARVWAVPANDELLGMGGRPRSHGAAWADDAGRFRIDGLGAGEYRLMIEASPDLVPPKPVRARAGEELPAIPLVLAARPTITVRDGTDRPVAGAEVHVHGIDEDRPWFAWRAIMAGKTDENGAARLGGLDPEQRYVLVIDPPSEGDDDLERLEITDWAPKDGSVRLRVIRSFTGAVLDREGIPVRRARVWYRMDEGEGWKKVWADEDGRFEIRKLTRTPASLRVGTSSAERDDAEVVEVSVDPDLWEVEIHIDGRPLLAVRVADWPADAKAVAHPFYRTSGGTLCHGKRPLRSDGRLRWHGIPKDSICAFWVALPDGRMAYAADLVPDAPERALSLRPGKTISGRVEIPPGARKMELSLWFDTFDVKVPLDSEGRFEVVGLPDGDYHLFARATVAAVKMKGDAKVRAGGEAVEISMKSE